MQAINILYVEDDAGSRKVMQFMVAGLLKNSYLTVFEDSQEFMARVQEIEPKPNLVMLDIHVEPLDGFAMLDLLRNSEAFGGLPIIALTASVMNEEVHKLRMAGFDGVLAKPLDPDKFPQQLERILDGEQVWNVVS